MTGRKNQSHGAGRPLVLVDLKKPFPKRMDRYTNDGVRVGIKIRPASKGLRRNRILFDLICPPREALLADVVQHSCQVA